jgi:hypothetical protein
MKVFVSWSGTLSKNVAELLASWLEDVLQNLSTWISTEDIDKGSIWFSDISNQLSETSVGILCLTSENICAPWILFEAGALAKGLTKNRVCPLCIDILPMKLTPPLSAFNATLPNKTDMLKLVKTINSQNTEHRLVEDKLEKAFERWWPDFESKLDKIKKAHKPPAASISRPDAEVLEEVLETVRAVQRTLIDLSFSLRAPSDPAIELNNKKNMLVALLASGRAESSSLAELEKLQKIPPVELQERKAAIQEAIDMRINQLSELIKHEATESFKRKP